MLLAAWIEAIGIPNCNEMLYRLSPSATVYVIWVGVGDGPAVSDAVGVASGVDVAVGVAVTVAVALGVGVAVANRATPGPEVKNIHTMNRAKATTRTISTPKIAGTTGLRRLGRRD